MTTHQPFRVRVPLQTSVRLGHFPASLDGLLWHCLFLRCGDPGRARDGLSRLLSYQDGVYRASALRFGVYPTAPLIATQQPIVGNMRSDTDLLREQFHPTGRGGKYRPIVVTGGPFKARLAKHETYYAPELTWDAVGDPKAVCELLNFYVFAIGREANRGFGSVGEFHWEPLAADTSWIDEDNNPARALPLQLWTDLSGSEPESDMTEMAQTTPPYRKGQETLCAIPPRVRRIRLHAPI